jgi:hypothetical protein
MSWGGRLLVAVVILVASAQVTLRSEDPNGTAIAAVSNVLANTGGDLNQYRPLSAYIAVGIQELSQTGTPPFQAIRFVQCLLLFGLAFVYYRRLELEPRTTLVGIGLVTGLVSLQLGTLGPNGFSMDRFFDAIFFLFGAILVLNNHGRWLPVVVAIAIANRETAVFMPALLLARVPLHELPRHKRLLGTAVAAWLIAAIVYVAIHDYYGPHPRTEESYWGPSMFLHSLAMPGQTAFFVAAVNLLPLLALLLIRDADPFLQRLFWMVVPLWFAIHIWAARLGEGLMYLVPLVLIGVPLVLQGLQRRLAPVAVSRAPAPPARLADTPRQPALAGLHPARRGQ